MLLALLDEVRVERQGSSRRLPVKRWKGSALPQRLKLSRREKWSVRMRPTAERGP